MDCSGPSDEHQGSYNPDGLSVGGRIQERACEYLELIFHPKGRNSTSRGVFAQCGWIIENRGGCCKIGMEQRKKDRVICPLDVFGGK